MATTKKVQLSADKTAVEIVTTQTLPKAHLEKMKTNIQARRDATVAEHTQTLADLDAREAEIDAKLALFKE